MRQLGMRILLVLALGLFQPFSTPPVTGNSLPSQGDDGLALVGAKVYPSPTAKPIEDATVLVRNGKLIAVGPRGKVKIPRNTKRIDCAGLTLVAGFWNSHVHFRGDRWAKAASMPPAQLTLQLEEMLTKYGFTTIFDTGSYLEVTKAIRERVTSGAADGPRIFTTGEILYPKGTNNPRMPEVEDARQGAEAARRQLDAGADAVKVYAQAWWNINLKVPPEAMKAITAEAHRRGKLVFVHPSNRYGLEAAIDSGADVLVHTTPQTSQWTEAQMAGMKRGNMALIPTLTLWRIELQKDGASLAGAQKFQDRGVNQLRAYFEAGGQILFGTDVGYITEYDTAEEYELMGRAGMRFQDILASLTTSPAARFGESKRTGRVAPGMDADLVLLAADPAADVKAFAKVRYTLRQGKVIYQAK